MKRAAYRAAVSAVSELSRLSGRLGRRERRHALRGVVYHAVRYEETDAFRRQLELMSFRGFVSLDDLVSGVDDGCLVTFDDGYRVNLETAVPLLEEYRVPAVFFITTGFVGAAPADVARMTPGMASLGLETLTEDELKELSGKYEVGSHTLTHSDLAAEGVDLPAETAGSKSRLEELIGKQVRAFAYPYGRPRNLTPAAVEAVRAAGYRFGFTAVRGDMRGADPCALPRDYIGPDWSTTDARAALCGCLDVLER